jgi:tetratricopeptide (TPR) repeat protein
MGAAYYQLEDWKNALEYFVTASADLPLNRRLLYALGNTAVKRGDYSAAQGFYNRLLNMLETQRSRLPVLLPNDRPEYLELAERLMMARNNAGVAYEKLAERTGDRSYRTRAMALYAEANRAWDARNRDPQSMIRSGSTPLPFLNSRNTLYPQPGYDPQLFIRIDRDVLEPSLWEQLAPFAGF